jgi:hypothetical protein
MRPQRELVYYYVCAMFKPQLNLPKWTWLKSVANQRLYSIGSVTYMQTRGLTGGPGVVDALLE